jgi:pimeloyl-ACP methyl ester carboxylesterase
VNDYDIEHLTGDLIGLLDHFGYERAGFIGHDWGAIIVWNLAMMHRQRVSAVANLSVPFMQRGSSEWVGFWEKMLGGDFYIVHFNRQPGVADEVFGNHTQQFLDNMYRTNQWQHPPVDLGPGMNMINMATAPELAGGMPGDPLMSDQEMQIFIDAFAISGFTGGINWYRNFSRNWEIIGAFEQYIHQPTLMIYGDYDMVPKSENLEDFVGDLTVHSFPCGHWIQQERPEDTNTALLNWLGTKCPA